MVRKPVSATPLATSGVSAPAKTARRQRTAAGAVAKRPGRGGAPVKTQSADTTPTRRRGRAHYHVYVIELSPAVLEEARFVRCNPGYVAGKPCVYVGMTGLDPDVRFDKHKAGIQHNRYVLRYGLRLLPDLYEGFNPMRYEDAAAREVEIGIDLRSAGWGVWQA